MREPMTPRAMSAGVLVGPSMPKRSNGRDQTKSDGSPKADRPHGSPQAIDDHRLLEREDHGGDNTGRARSYGDERVLD